MRHLRRQMQIIFQDPFSSLNPRKNVAHIVGEPLLVHGMTNRQEREARVLELLRVVGLKREHMRRYPHQFSGGQRQRIGIDRARALAGDVPSPISPPPGCRFHTRLWGPSILPGRLNRSRTQRKKRHAGEDYPKTLQNDYITSDAPQ